MVKACIPIAHLKPESQEMSVCVWVCVWLGDGESMSKILIQKIILRVGVDRKKDGYLFIFLNSGFIKTDLREIISCDSSKLTEREVFFYDSYRNFICPSSFAR